VTPAGQPVTARPLVEPAPSCAPGGRTSPRKRSGSGSSDANSCRNGVVAKGHRREERRRPDHAAVVFRRKKISPSFASARQFSPVISRGVACRAQCLLTEMLNPRRSLAHSSTGHRAQTLAGRMAKRRNGPHFLHHAVYISGRSYTHSLEASGLPHSGQPWLFSAIRPPEDGSSQGRYRHLVHCLKHDASSYAEQDITSCSVNSA
jgi:hypothetical protein